MAKMRLTKKKETPEIIEDSERWIVVGSAEAPNPGRPIYLQSKVGKTEAEAKALASRLAYGEAVPLIVRSEE